jgi:hypothetical protein
LWRFFTFLGKESFKTHTKVFSKNQNNPPKINLVIFLRAFFCFFRDFFHAFLWVFIGSGGSKTPLTKFQKITPELIKSALSTQYPAQPTSFFLVCFSGALAMPASRPGKKKEPGPRGR